MEEVGVNYLKKKKGEGGSSKSLHKPFKVKVGSLGSYYVACQLSQVGSYYKCATQVSFLSLAYDCI